jgi:ferritin-like protein
MEIMLRETSIWSIEGESRQSPINGTVGFQQKYWPYSYTTVIRKLTQGESREKIIEDAAEAVKEKRKSWYIISARLDFMTYEMPGHITVLPYRDVSSTTVAMADPLGH